MNFSRINYLLRSGNIIKKGQRKFYKKFLEHPFGRILFFLPIKSNRIVFDNFGGKGFGDNVKYIAQGLIKANKDYELIWLVDNISNYEFPDIIKAIPIDSVLALYYRATAKVWIDNVRHLHPVKKKINQIYLQAWHGPFGPKKAEADAEKELGEDYVREAKYDGQIADGIISNSKLLDNQFKRAFWLSDKVEILKYGLPRNDLLIKKRSCKGEVDRLKEKYNIEKNIFYVLYAPTFRDDYSIDGYKLEFKKIASAFSKKVGKEVNIIVRLHPNVKHLSDFINYDNQLIDGTNYPDMQELMLVSDVLISDYSSSIFDFSLLKKPVFICALDLNHYKRVRGILPEFYEFPFPKATSNCEMIENIESFDKKLYFNKVNEYFNKYPNYDDGHATERVVQWIQSKMKR